MLDHIAEEAVCPLSPEKTLEPDKKAIAASVAGLAALGASNPVFAGIPGSNTNRRLHVIRRLTFGYTPALNQEVRQLGINGFIEQQLNPSAIPDSEVDEAVSVFTRLNQSTISLIRERRRALVRQELNAGTLVRAVSSRRQLQEVMTDFWSNHFSVDTNKKRTVEFKVAEDRLFRLLALGKFSSLLLASAKSPAMLEYLDNRSSRANGGRIPNENYARELLELHTVGVDGGFDEQDVLEVAYVLSGWSIDNTNYQFRFFPNRNRLGPLNSGGDVLGWVPVAAERSVTNGESLLDHLAHHPATARFVCWKLCRHFVSDNIAIDDPFVQTIASVYLANDTAIVPTLRAIFTSARFLDSAGQKVRRPNEFLYATLRSSAGVLGTGNSRRFARDARSQLMRFGQTLFEAPSPAGYPDVAVAFINTNAMVNRWNYGLALSHNESRLANTDIASLLDSPTEVRQLIDQLSVQLMGQRLQRSERRSLFAYLGKSGRSTVSIQDLEQAPTLAGLIFASASYQIR